MNTSKHILAVLHPNGIPLDAGMPDIQIIERSLDNMLEHLSDKLTLSNSEFIGDNVKVLERVLPSVIFRKMREDGKFVYLTNFNIDEVGHPISIELVTPVYLRDINDDDHSAILPEVSLNWAIGRFLSNNVVVVTKDEETIFDAAEPGFMISRTNGIFARGLRSYFAGTLRIITVIDLHPEAVLAFVEGSAHGMGEELTIDEIIACGGLTDNWTLAIAEYLRSIETMNDGGAELTSTQTALLKGGVAIPINADNLLSGETFYGGDAEDPGEGVDSIPGAESFPSSVNIPAVWPGSVAVESTEVAPERVAISIQIDTADPNPGQTVQSFAESVMADREYPYARGMNPSITHIDEPAFIKVPDPIKVLTAPSKQDPNMIDYVVVGHAADINYGVRGVMRDINLEEDLTGIDNSTVLIEVSVAHEGGVANDLVVAAAALLEDILIAKSRVPKPWDAQDIANFLANNKKANALVRYEFTAYIPHIGILATSDKRAMAVQGKTPSNLRSPFNGIYMIDDTGELIKKIYTVPNPYRESKEA